MYLQELGQALLRKDVVNGADSAAGLNDGGSCEKGVSEGDFEATVLRAWGFAGGHTVTLLSDLGLHMRCITLKGTD